MNPTTSPQALLIIDMQRGMADAKAGRRNNPQAEDNIARLLAAWRQAGQPVVHVRHLSRSPTSAFWPGQTGAEFQPRFEPLATEHVVEKNVTDAFVCSGLERWLHVRGIRDLYVVGVSTNYSVEATVRSSGNLGFHTTVVSDATFTFDMQDISGLLRLAEDVHVMSLSNLRGEYATVLNTAELLEQIHTPSGRENPNDHARDMGL
ncbi:cysteine hydrolase [Rhodoferax sp. AJA081-3]|uniref:cysteine hydrolase family protein n=1 Tax=Rhodoferax sp. AJA081-3 TaxID=2752316 RepID=UPI001ADFBABE|nr:cysteine hydrolase family protein [Rhodoferax sp. AJA081-3]QTN27979.1 cysteine hydrolase [Rhodoferax sp. AJA081-3]